MTGAKTRKRMSLRTRIILILAALLLLGFAGGLGYFHYGPPEKTCLACHEIQASYDHWAVSSHRAIPCKECHGGTLSSGLHGLRRNAGRAWAHFAGGAGETMRLSEQQLADMTEACRACHQSEYSNWLAGGHSVFYAAIFLDETFNKTNPPTADCLRCHGMFFEGTIADVVAPISVGGPWRLVNSQLAARPAIPCLACHHVHTSGTVATPPYYPEPRTIHSKRAGEMAKVDFYDRREKAYFAAEELPVARIRAAGKPVAVSPDPRQRVCVQCHAPESSLEAGTADDRTPCGVHEGLSCTACHEPHSNDARWSCAGCHPALSNCGLDVEKMDTTYRSPDSKHNIHFVACTDCHPEGAAR